MRIFVTVGMGPWPFDRLVGALGPVCAGNDVFVQTGTSALVPPCAHAPFIGWAETQRRLREADVVITHAGNTVRLVQRLGKVPVAIAREAARGEMRNDHQVRYLAEERHHGRVVPMDGDLADLAAVVAAHPAAERALLAVAPPLPRLDPGELTRLLDAVTARVTNPHRPPSEFGPVRGAGRAQIPNLNDESDGSLRFAELRWPSGRALLSEARRVLVPGGELVVTKVARRRREEVLAALTAAGFTPYWCDGDRVTARRVAG